MDRPGRPPVHHRTHPLPDLTSTEARACRADNSGQRVEEPVAANQIFGKAATQHPQSVVDCPDDGPCPGLSRVQIRVDQADTGVGGQPGAATARNCASLTDKPGSTAARRS